MIFVALANNSASVGSLICHLKMGPGMGYSYLSTDGETYTENEVDVYELANPTMVSDGSLFYAFWSGNVDYYHTSSDGLEWTSHSLPSTMENPFVIYADGKFVLIDTVNGVSMVSLNGATWTQGTAPIMYGANIAYSEPADVFLLAGQDENYATSTDGLIWTARTLPESIGGAVAVGVTGAACVSV